MSRARKLRGKPDTEEEPGWLLASLDVLHGAGARTMRASRTARSAVIRTPTGLQIESWRLLWEELTRNAEAIAECREWEDRRRRVRPQMLELLRRFLSGAIDLEELRATFDRRTKTSWDAFGLRGMSGAMFLNKLVKYVPDSAKLAEQLRAVLPAPRSTDTGRARLGAFVAFLEDLARRGSVDTKQLQPARAAFFTTIWWHLQDTERWPGFQLSARNAMQLEEGLYAPTGDPVEDYFSFREIFRALASALDLTSWEFEYLCWWHQHRERVANAEDFYETGRLRTPRVVRERAIKVPVSREMRSEPGVRAERPAPEHTHIQWLLAKIGKRLGCRVWIAANDWKREWQGESLGALSIQRLPPLGMDPDSQRVISLIDVVWLKRTNQVAAAFEVEHTTAIYSGLLRMADLAALSPNLNFPLYIVAPESRLEKVRRELLRPTFQLLELHRRSAFFSAEALVEAAESIMRWGSGPGVIARLARRAEGEWGGEG